MFKKSKLNIHLTKSPKREQIYKLCLYMLEKHEYINIVMCSKAEI